MDFYCLLTHKMSVTASASTATAVEEDEEFGVQLISKLEVGFTLFSVERDNILNGLFTGKWNYNI